MNHLYFSLFFVEIVEIMMPYSKQLNIQQKKKNIIIKMNIKNRQLLQQLVYGSKTTNKKEKNSKIHREVYNQDQFIQNQTFPLISFGLFSFENGDQLKYFSKFLYKSINYAIKNLEKPTQDLIKEKKTQIKCKFLQNSDLKKKILFLDLDQTLIHCNSSLQSPHIKLFHTNSVYKINIRPYCIQFLRKISNFFDVYIFTASTLGYAQPIVKYLNEDHPCISGILHREHCLRTKNGLYIKDLRIIENVELKDIVIVDNKIHSFSFHLQNGIPVQQFTGCQNDQVLLGLQIILMELVGTNDIAQFLKKKLKLRQIIQQPFHQFNQTIQGQYNLEKKKKSKENI